MNEGDMTEELVVPISSLSHPDVPNLLDKLVRHLEGWRDSEGTLHKGVIDRLEVIEEREVIREKARQDREAQRRVVMTGLGLASAGVVLTQITTWFSAHFK